MKQDLRVIKGNETKERILQAALEVLSDEGESGFSASKVAKKAGISKAALFHHFPKVDEIPFSLAQKMVDMFSAEFPVNRYKSVSSYLTGLGNAIFKAHPEQLKIGTVFLGYYIRAVHDERYRKIQERIIHSFIDQLAGHFAIILDRELTKNEEDTLPLITSMGFEGLSLYFNVMDDKSKLRKAWKTFSKLIEHLLEED